jgi:hypothetical protein
MTSKKSSQRGRPKGKRSNPDYVQACGYIRKSVYKRVKHRMLDEDIADFGGLMESLLIKWLEE